MIISVFIVIVIFFILCSLLKQLITRSIKSSNLIKRNSLIQSLIDEDPKQPIQSKPLIIGFLHPYCNAGGGGERVLWTAISLHQRSQPQSICAVYTGDLDFSKSQIIQNVKQRFGISLDHSSLALIPLKTRHLVEASTWPRCTLLGQSLGSIVLGYEALTALIPDIFIDTMGYAFTFPVFRLLADIPIGAYVHYPTISNDMIDRVSTRYSAHNNSSTISNSMVLSSAKLIYYRIFAEIYSLCLRQADHLMVNSSWTKNHIDLLLQPWLYRDKRQNNSLQEIQTFKLSKKTSSSNQIHGLRLRIPTIRESSSESDRENSRSSSQPDDKRRNYKQATIVYPPCDVQSFLDFPLSPRSPTILSISQFRPEKDQAKQIKAFAKFLADLKSDLRPAYKLILAGSCRDQADQARVEELRQLSKQLQVADSVEFQVNISWDQLKDLLRDSTVGLSTMIDEHFGISIVEFMASGLIPLVHASGGPLLDIVVPVEEEEEGIQATGFHAKSVETFADQLTTIFERLNDQGRSKIQTRARELAHEKFNVQRFEQLWLACFQILVQKQCPPA